MNNNGTEASAPVPFFAAGWSGQGVRLIFRFSIAFFPDLCYHHFGLERP